MIAFAALANGALLGMIMLLRGVAGQNRAAVFSGALALVGACAGTLILAGELGGGIVEMTLMLLTGPLVFAIVCHLVRPPVPWAVFGAILLAEIAIVFATRNLVGFDPIGFATFCQMGFTVAGWWVFAHDRRPARADRRTRVSTASRAAFAILSAVSIIHLAQLVRLGFPKIAALSDIVPVTISVALAALTVFALFSLLTPSSLAALLPERKPVPRDAEALLNRLRAAIEQDGLADPDLRIEAVAAVLGESAAALQKVVIAAGYTGFRGYLQSLRIERAKWQLADPDEERTSIDAISLGCGFRSRSAFYEAFRKETGQTPGEYRSRSIP